MCAQSSREKTSSNKERIRFEKSRLLTLSLDEAKALKDFLEKTFGFQVRDLEVNEHPPYEKGFRCW